ncbi:hypothetical protein D3C87_2013430 [compost metagenome]
MVLFRWVSRLLKRFTVFLRCYLLKISKFPVKGSVLAACHRVAALPTMVCLVPAR